MDPFGSKAEKAKQAKALYERVLGGTIAKIKADPSHIDAAAFIVRNPKLVKADLGVALQSPEFQAEFDTNALDNNDIQEINRLLMLFRGAQIQ